jgi:hypothetical protein
MKHPLLTHTALIAAALLSTTAMAQGSAQHFSQAGGHSAGAVGHSIAGVGKGAAAIIAVPLAIGGSAGHASAHAADELIDFANYPIGKPLPLGCKQRCPDPAPDQAIQQ